MSSNSPRILTRLGLGDACRLYGFTPRALRFYEERGLVSSRRDRLNARWYDGPARQRLDWIARLRGVGFSLRDIHQVLEAAEGSERRAREAASAKLRSRLAALQDECERAEALLAALASDAEATPNRRRA